MVLQMMKRVHFWWNWLLKEIEFKILKFCYFLHKNDDSKFLIIKVFLKNFLAKFILLCIFINFKSASIVKKHLKWSSGASQTLILGTKKPVYCELLYMDIKKSVSASFCIHFIQKNQCKLNFLVWIENFASARPYFILLMVILEVRCL